MTLDACPQTSARRIGALTPGGHSHPAQNLLAWTLLAIAFPLLWLVANKVGKLALEPR